ncbi:MAG: cupin domain-containing protein [Clostridia bacterium]
MEMDVKKVSERIRGMREILKISAEDMAKATDTTSAEYIACENGECDFSFTFLLKCSQKFGIDIVELLSGTDPKLSMFTVARNGEGLALQRRAGFEYLHKAHLFKGKLVEPFVVTAPYIEAEQAKPIKHSTHDGQELDFVLSGSLKIDLNGHITVLEEGDSIFYDSSIPHGMIAVNGSPCEFLAVVIPKATGGA